MDVQNIVYNLVKLPNRLILCIEEAKDWDKLEMFDFIKQVGPEGLFILNLAND